jgi:hypothetical protein
MGALPVGLKISATKKKPVLSGLITRMDFSCQSDSEPLKNDVK